MNTPKQITERLEYLRGELRAERISYGELAELQSLAKHIAPGDVELLEPAGVPEFPEDAPHQPGEWYLGNGIRHHDTIGICTGRMDGGEWIEETIAEVLPGCPRAKMEEQARLIASAPALLHILRKITDDADDTGCDGCYVVSGEFIEAARAIIAEATP